MFLLSYFQIPFFSLCIPYCSFHILLCKSLIFSSIPRERMQNLLEKLLKENYLNNEIVEEYMKLTRLYVCDNYFQFIGKLYRQKGGLAMGSPLSPFLADLFMGD